MPTPDLALDFDVGSFQARLLSFEQGAAVQVPPGYGPADMTGVLDDRTRLATQFFQKSFNHATPPAGYALATLLPTTGDLNDARTRLALRYDVDVPHSVKPSELYVASNVVPASSSSSGGTVAMVAGGIALAAGAAYVATRKKKR